ncbi:MAG: hydroxymethylbilane synthase [Candidatus Methylomirabilales bacterium]
MNRELHIGTRGSPLAVVQAELVASALRAQDPPWTPTLVRIRTSGDRLQTAPLAASGGKGLFVKEIDEALLAGTIDLAVHSMKDLPAALTPGIALVAILPRADARDALITREARGLRDLQPGGRIGTSSLRRQAQLKARRPDLEVLPLRGNLNTRLRKLTEEGLDAVVLAAAGLSRLGLTSRITELLAPTVCLPAIGQGAIGVEMRADDPRRPGIRAALNHDPSWIAVAAERSFLGRLGGGCQVPIAGYATLREGKLTLEGLVATPDGRRLIRDSHTGPIGEAEAIGRGLAESLLGRGAGEILRELEAMPLGPPGAG